MTELSIIYSMPATSSDLEKQSSATPDCIKHSIASARRSELIEQLTSRRKANGGEFLSIFIDKALLLGRA